MSAQPVSTQPAFNTLIDQAARQFVSSLSPQAVRTFNGRLERGLFLAKANGVSPQPLPGHAHRYAVRSSDGTHTYIVDLDTRSCECPDSLKGRTCKHRIAAYYYEQASQMAAAAQPEPQPAPASDREAQIMQELGFAPQPQKVKENHKAQALCLGSLFRQVLTPADLQAQPLTAPIADITCETSTTADTWLLWLKPPSSGKLLGIPLDVRSEDELVSIFGKVSFSDLQGKPVQVFAQDNVLHFREAK